MPEFGMFAVDHAARRVRGYLIPWNRRSRESLSKTKPITFPRDSVRIPRDPGVVSLNVAHDRFAPIGRAVVLESREAGLFAEFDIANTDEGDAWLSDRGDFAALSAELRDIRRSPGDVGTAVLTGAAVVTEGAFEGTGLFAAADAKPDEDPAPAPDEDDPDEAGDDEDEHTEDDPEQGDNEGEDVGDAIAPGTMLAGRRPAAKTPALTKTGFMSALRGARQSGDYGGLKPYLESAEAGGLFALSDIKFDATGGLYKDATFPAAWLGELWQGRRFVRKIVPLLTSGTLTSLSATGWIWTTKPTMAEWAGNRANVPSNTPVVAPKTFAAQRYAGGHDLAREYFDFGVTEVIDSYVDAMVDSYATLSDAYALTQLTTGATAFTPGSQIGASAGFSAIIDGALAVVAAQATPAYAIVAPDVFRNVMSVEHSNALEYFDAALSLEGGSSNGFAIVPDSRLAAGTVIVGAKEAATAWELPGVPIRVSAPDLVKGGIDEAFFGYIAVGVTYPAAVVKATVTLTAAAKPASGGATT